METLLVLLSADTLTRLVFFPAIACLPLLFARRDAHGPVKVYALVVSLLHLGLTLLFVARHWNEAGFAFREVGLDGRPIEWISLPGLRILYDLRVDGISMPLVVLTSLLLPVVLLGSWKGVERHWRGFAASLLLLQTGILGALVAFDLFLFYVFWEVMLVPMYFVIGVWGGERRIYAAVKFFLFTMAGSLLMLLAILWLGWTHSTLTGGVWSFALDDMLRLQLPVSQQLWLFGAFALAFAIKVPMFPFHTWLPDAHVEAPTGGSVVLAGILLKLGTYGFLRFAMPLFPVACRELTPWLIGAALVGIVYGALVAWVQDDIKKLVAYSSIAHLGFVMLGLLAIDLLAWQGALLQMVNHGLSTGALFLLVGMLYDRRHTKKFADFGGLAKVMPWFAFFLTFSALASVGLPGLNGFVGEFLILVGTYRAGLQWQAIVGAFGVILAAVYLLRMLHETLFGPIRKEENRNLPDLSLREVAALAPLCILMLWIGVAPRPFLAPSEAALRATLTEYRAGLERPPVTRPVLRPSPGAVALAGQGLPGGQPGTTGRTTP
ncbi:MAG: NADH-quinone oxidoreductase subunit M [Thermoanaerobaculia bacterium]|nr:NADH-quinone oxidoreductase subunit M [Thermoanaerobaculia bacterium]